MDEKSTKLLAILTAAQVLCAAFLSFFLPFTLNIQTSIHAPLLISRDFKVNYAAFLPLTCGGSLTGKQAGHGRYI
jgi:hypothetical protein